MSTLSASARCLGHGCGEPDKCLRHLVIRQRQRPAGEIDVFENACAISAHARVPVVLEWRSTNHDSVWRQAIEGDE